MGRDNEWNEKNDVALRGMYTDGEQGGRGEAFPRNEPASVAYVKQNVNIMSECCLKVAEVALAG